METREIHHLYSRAINDFGVAFFIKALFLVGNSFSRTVLGVIVLLNTENPHASEFLLLQNYTRNAWQR